VETLKKIVSNQYFPAAAVLTAVVLFWTIAMFGGLSLLHNNQPPMATLTWMLFVYAAAVLTPLAGIIAAANLIRRWRRNRQYAQYDSAEYEAEFEMAEYDSAESEMAGYATAEDEHPAAEAPRPADAPAEAPAQATPEAPAQATPEAPQQAQQRPAQQRPAPHQPAKQRTQPKQRKKAA
jgi:hypothetical protein